MISYRFRRRAFLTALGGGLGLKIMLRNLEGSAQGMKSPGRLLVSLWPCGIVAGANDALWKPTSGSVIGSPALKPFADAGLGPDMTVIRGLSTAHLSTAGTGDHEGGTVTLLTGKAPIGSRANCCEGDDAIAAPGGSFEQILLKDAAALQRPDLGFANSIGDSRTDFDELSAQCASYSTTTGPVTLYNKVTPGVVDQALPLKPRLSPSSQFTALFGSMVPGTGGAGGGGGMGGTAPLVADATLKKLVGRRSVLDFAVEELNQLRQLAPSGARGKLTIHTDAVMAAESSVVNAINAGYPSRGGNANGDPTCGGGCASRPPGPPADLPSVAGPPDELGGDPNSIAAAKDDTANLAAVGGAHLDVLKAAFICDVIRVGTFMWTSTTSHAAFRGLYPGNVNATYRHGPFSRIVRPEQTVAASTVAGLDAAAQFLYNVQVWYFHRQATHMMSWKKAVDGCGNSLLDFTCAPFLTDVAGVSYDRSNMPAMLIGGRRMGFLHDRYAQGQITINQLWGTIAQAYGSSSSEAPFAAPVSGFWAQPA